MSWLRIVECSACRQSIIIGEDDLIYRTVRNHTLRHEIAHMVLFRCYECEELQYLPPSIANKINVDVYADTGVEIRPRTNIGADTDIDDEFDMSDTPVYTIEPTIRRNHDIKKQNDKTKKGF